MRKPREPRLPKGINREVIKDLLRQVCSSAFGGQVKRISDYTLVSLSPYNKKSYVYDVTGLNYEGDSHIRMPGHLLLKVYRGDGPDYIKEKCSREFIVEKTMLALSGLKVNFGSRPVKVYPECYSTSVSDCDKRLTIVREFIEEPSLQEFVLEQQKNKTLVKWEEIKTTLETICLLHSQGSWVAQFKEGGLGIQIPKRTPDYVASNIIKHLSCLYFSATGQEIDSDKKAEIGKLVSAVAKDYLFREEKDLVKVINGDLGVCPHHATKNILLDAGGTCIGPITDDLALYTDTIFEGVLDSKGMPMRLLDRINATVEDYLNYKGSIEERLGQQNGNGIRINREEFLTSLLISSSLLSIRAASSVLTHYVPNSRGFHFTRIFSKGVGDTPSWIPKNSSFKREDAEKEVRGYLSNLFCLLDIIKSEDKRFDNLDELLKGLSLNSPFVINKGINARLLNGSGVVDSRENPRANLVQTPEENSEPAA